MSERKSPLDLAFDLWVYAPLGFALSARDLVPALADKGRKQVRQQVVTARVMGEYAVTRARRRVDDVARRARRQAEASLRGLGLATTVAPPRSGAPTAPAPGAPQRPSGGDGKARWPRPDPSGLAIPGYDSLPASHVVQRLDGLSGPEL